MSDVVRRRPAASDDATDGHDLASGSAGLRPATLSGDDPDAIRARLAASSALGGEASVRVGLAPADGVSTQRHPVLDGTPTDMELVALGGDRYLLREGSSVTPILVGPASPTSNGAVREVLVGGFRFEVETVADRRATLRERATRAGSAFAATGPLEVRAVIPGKVLTVAVAAGDTVTAGQQLLVVEAMKMQNELRSPRDGTITRVGVGPGVNIELGDVLVVIS
jgi:biotin carboxyl carrier protein